MNQIATTQAERHSLFEDAQALFTGTLLVALGIVMFKSVGLLTGGTAGLAFLVHYSTGLPFGLAFFLINLPFYWLAIKRMGWPFTVKTFIAIGLLSAFTELAPWVLRFELLNPLLAGLAGGLLMGVGFLILFRHQASLGGLNILVFYLQDRFGWRAGKVQMAVDCAILAGSLFFVAPWLIAISLLGATALNLALATNHKPGRYLAF